MPRIRDFNPGALESLEDGRLHGGCSANQNPIQGIGRRGQELETNVHHKIEVFASLWRGTWPYFRALRKELQACSGEEQILILHQHATIA